MRTSPHFTLNILTSLTTEFSSDSVGNVHNTHDMTYTIFLGKKKIKPEISGFKDFQ